jgi:hypothetical protein
MHPVYTLPPIYLRSTLTLSSHLPLGLPSVLFPSGFPTKIHFEWGFRYNYHHNRHSDLFFCLLLFILYLSFPASQILSHRVWVYLFCLCRWTLYWASWISSTSSHHVTLRFFSILSFLLFLGLPWGPFYSCLRIEVLCTLIISPICYMPRYIHPPWYNHSNNILWRIQIRKLLIMLCSLSSSYFFCFWFKYSQHFVIRYVGRPFLRVRHQI